MQPSQEYQPTTRVVAELHSVSSLRDVFALGAVLVGAIAWAL
jgi:hypothetical protein